MGSLHCARSGCASAHFFAPLGPVWYCPWDTAVRHSFAECGEEESAGCLDPAWCLRAGEGNPLSFITILFNICWKWEEFRGSSTSQLQCRCLLVPGGGRKGRPDELFPISVGGVIPGVGLDEELLAAKAQTAPAQTKVLQENWNGRGNTAGSVGTLTVCQGGRCSTSCTRRSRTRGCSRWWQNRPACSIRPTWTASPARQGRMSTERRLEREEQYEESAPLVTVGPAPPMLTGPSKLWL